MKDDLFEVGLAQRKGTLGAEYVEKNLAAADDITRPFQEAMTAWCSATLKTGVKIAYVAVDGTVSITKLQ